jgi:serine/threonine-protein kinase
MYVVGAALVYWLVPEQFITVHLHPAKLINLGLIVASWFAYRALKHQSLSRRPVFGLDLGILVMVSVGIGGALAHAPTGYHLEFAGLLVLVLILIVRAALVPSSPEWTALVGLLASPATVSGAYREFASSPLGPLPAVGVVIGLGLWCIAAIGVSAFVSRIVYGLVRQVEEATQLGQYTLGAKLGEGGMGAVYRAEHALLRRPTAVKLLLPERLGAANLARFEREVQLTALLSHPNTVAIYDYGRTFEGTFYYAMEYLEGRTLEQIVEQEGPQSEARVVHILRQVAGSLREAHDLGLIHRDIKPSNILLCQRGGIPEFVKVIDFGLVKQVQGDGNANLTQANAITGTPLYMAPESLTSADAITPSVDTYALGCVAYYLLTGAPPFTGVTIVEVCGHHLLSAPVPVSERRSASTTPALEALVHRCLAKQSGERPSDTELLEALTSLQRALPLAVLGAL